MVKKGFTLIEVNLAMLVMAGAVLSLVSLYSLGFRESREAREDLAATALAETVINPLVIALSDPDLKWSQWQSGFNLRQVSGQQSTGFVADYANALATPSQGQEVGWRAYLDIHTGVGADGWYRVRSASEMKSLAQNVYNSVKSVYDTNGEKSRVVKVSLPSAPDWSSRGMVYALVVSRESEKSPVMTIAVRCVRTTQVNTLLSQPVFATEVHFQGDPNS